MARGYFAALLLQRERTSQKDWKCYLWLNNTVVHLPFICCVFTHSLEEHPAPEQVFSPTPPPPPPKKSQILHLLKDAPCFVVIKVDPVFFSNPSSCPFFFSSSSKTVPSSFSPFFFYSSFPLLFFIFLHLLLVISQYMCTYFVSNLYCSCNFFPRTAGVIIHLYACILLWQT